MYNNFDNIKNMTLEQILYFFINALDEKKVDIKQIIYRCILNESVDYATLYKILPMLDHDDVSIILNYDKDYSIDFLLALKDKAYEDDLTKQAIYLLRRHNLNYIIPLLKYVDEDEIRIEYLKK